uniref:Uncharacterized protein n=1 Tax=Angiostrongylus cantonensis TaxID=6313 RepID=A0A158PAS9_ANGCA
MDDFNAYRAMCANRLRRLERYKKARSFCNIDDDEPSIAERSSNVRNPPSSEGISTFQLSLVENDMSLLQQLITLGDQITEMKKLKEQNLRKCQSQSSLDNENDNEDQFDDGFSASMSEVTTFCVGESQPQYFSRQNSVLRIPIPPRNSNRFGHRRIVSCNTISNIILIILSIRAFSVDNSLYERCSIDPSYIAVKNRSSNSSIDSGIRESSSSSPSPTFEKEVI